MSIRQVLIRKRGAFCEICGSPDNLEVHHWLLHRMKGHPELDCEENCGLVCAKCHAFANGYQTRVTFWQRQKARGYDMLGWLKSLPLKVKQNYE